MDDPRNTVQHLKGMFWACGLSACFGMNAAYAADLGFHFPVSTFGTPGLIDMPSGEVFEDGRLHTSFALHRGVQKYNLTFQIAPRLFGSFRYAIVDGFDGGDGARYDRSFDLGYQLLTESDRLPSVVVGLRDFGGTGVYSSEYLAATKHFLDGRLSLTGGIGWGRLGSYGGFSNPLGVLSDRFKTRTDAIGEAGELNTDQWFRGDAAFFGGLSYQISPRLSVKLEYSSDAYATEVRNTGFDHKTPINAALTYGFKNGADLSLYALHGSEFGVMLNLPMNPKNRRQPSGIEEAPPP